jgi:hypothetical protein
MNPPPNAPTNQIDPFTLLSATRIAIPIMAKAAARV